MLVILIAQTGLVWLMCITISFRVMGRDFDSAVTAAGFCGFMLGTTSNAVACMEELVEKYGPAPRSFLVVPVVGRLPDRFHQFPGDHDDGEHSAVSATADRIGSAGL